MSIEHISTKLMVANPMTKALAPKIYKYIPAFSNFCFDAYIHAFLRHFMGWQLLPVVYDIFFV